MFLKMPGVQSAQVLLLHLLWTGFAHTTGEARRVHTQVDWLIGNRDRPLKHNEYDTAMLRADVYISTKVYGIA